MFKVILLIKEIINKKRKQNSSKNKIIDISQYQLKYVKIGDELKYFRTPKH